ncbi:CRTAC1 family protein [Gaetbulibacter aquiaggeris]|uniref:CRTAC1 family protein n=1 Tax=Gaetbulibacter aquiaggeris TaxID=1735373 RepID=A0ABW7MQQ0_9FLAO
MILIISFWCCQKSNHDEEVVVKLFEQIDPKISGVHFINEISESETFHYYQYIYSYNGGGVAVLDMNNDGLQDIFFTSNISENRLYLNQGNFKFNDISSSSGILGKEGFKTGVTVVDINEDGFDDLYVCRAGWYNDLDIRKNLLYINNGDLTFTESAKEYGLDDSNRTISASFFDYDKDGDLDLYLANAPVMTKNDQNIIAFDVISNNPETPELGGSDKFYRNEGNGKFKDISTEAGLPVERAFGLNAQVGDLNDDGWLDVYVSNDFLMPDFAFINNGDGSFTDMGPEMFKHTSFYSMGSDIADLNNDGSPDLVVLDMNPEDYVRSKMSMPMTTISKFDAMVKSGYQYQYMQNVLQINNQNGTFSELGNLSGIAATDWSWSSLIADFDLDGLSDIYITNGIYRDLIDQDANDEIVRIIRNKGLKPTEQEFFRYTQMLPQHKLLNYFFKNNGDLTFSNNSEKWIDMNPTFSNGAAYADLDNDGDLDLIVNNINDKASILKNNAIELGYGNFIKFEFEGPEHNKEGIGVKVSLFIDDGSIIERQLIRSRGYLSAMSKILHIGIGKDASISKIIVEWPDGKEQKVEGFELNQTLSICYLDASDSSEKGVYPKTKIVEEVEFPFKHKDSLFNDFGIQYLLPYKLSQLGPAIASADINNDGYQDIYLGGGYLQEGKLLLSGKDGFRDMRIPDFEKDKLYEDVGAIWFDADNDDDLDLYVVSGSCEYQEMSPYLEDRLYINDGAGNLSRCTSCLPLFFESGQTVANGDFDGDGDEDLFVGGRLIPGAYPYPPTSYLLENVGGKFQIVTQALAPDLKTIGMVTDAVWKDIDSDGDLDLILTGEWMGIEIFVNTNGKLEQNWRYDYLSEVKGLWNKLLVEDVDDDGDLDIIAGNLGLNSKYHATNKDPLRVYAQDFDKNSSVDIFLTKYDKGREVPIRGKASIVQQIPSLQKKFFTYKEFSSKDINGIVGKDLKHAYQLKATELKSGIFINNGKGKFSFWPFPNEVQISPVNDILYEDFDGDGVNDLFLAGNNYQTEVETTRLDAGIGSLLLGQENSSFLYVPNHKTGLIADKDVRGLIFLKDLIGKHILIVNNDETHQLYRLLTD